MQIWGCHENTLAKRFETSSPYIYKYISGNLKILFCPLYLHCIFTILHWNRLQGSTGILRGFAPTGMISLQGLAAYGYPCSPLNYRLQGLSVIATGRINVCFLNRDIPVVITSKYIISYIYSHFPVHSSPDREVTGISLFIVQLTRKLRGFPCQIQFPVRYREIPVTSLSAVL